MHNIDPNDLDAIFREGADSQEYPYNDAAWADMSAKLDKRDSRRKAVILLLSLLIIAAVGFGIVQALYTAEVSTSETLTDAPSVPSVTIAKDNIAKATSTTQSPAVQGHTADKNSNTTTVDRNTKGKDQADTPTTKSSQESMALVQEATYTPSVTSLEQTQFNNSNYIATVAKIHLSSTTEETIVNSPLQASEQSTAATSVTDEARVDMTIASIYRLTNDPLEYSRKIERLAPALFDKDISLVPTSKYFFTLHGAPEWSAVRLLERGRRGWKLGATVGLGIGNNVEIYTGLGISKKVYEGGGSDYDMQGGWIDDIMPVSMDAKCYIADIPLGATYYFNGRNEDGFFVDAGVSSYFISSEWYGFDYTEDDFAFLAANNSKPIMEVNEANESRHFVGVGNLSIGYQKTLASGIHIQVAPYTQLPLTGIGSGKVKLHSSGIRLAMKFSK